jgi:hypothetical protein
MDGAEIPLAVEGKKTASGKRGSRLPRHQTVPLPERLLSLQDVKDIVPSFGFPSPDVFLRRVGREIDQTTTAAAQAFHGFRVFHPFRFPGPENITGPDICKFILGIPIEICLMSTPERKMKCSNLPRRWT